jgi:hypothetical protein
MGCGDDGACRVEGCVTGFADCDGDALGKSGPELTGSSGCEYSFGEVRSGAQPLSVPEQTMFVDGSRTDWTDIPAYAIDQACEDCSGTDDRTAPVVSPRSVPVPQDLTAYFRIAWDASNLYVLAEAFDNGLVSGGDATREDGVLLLFDGLDNREPGSTYGNDDTRVYIGLSDAHVGFNRGLQQAQLQASHQANGLFCYRIEAQISWRYIVGFDEQNSQGKFPPTPNQTYGFDISINDWDPAPGGAEPVVPEHRNQIFWVNPGDEWWFRSQGFGGIKLVGEGATPSDAGVQ